MSDVNLKHFDSVSEKCSDVGDILRFILNIGTSFRGIQVHNITAEAVYGDHNIIDHYFVTIRYC